MNKDYVCNNRKCRTPERGNAIRERPILFSGPMVRAILEGRKSMTRRVVKPVPSDVWGHGVITDTRSTKFGKFCVHMRGEFCGDVHVECPYGQPGERLWVREAWRVEGSHTDIYSPECIGANRAHFGRIDYEASITWNKSMYGKLRPSIHMPRWASRITLEVTGVRVERLLEISEQDAIAEGVERVRYAIEPHDAGFRDYIGDVVLRSARHSFETLWVKINGRESWDANPWVWVVEFRRVENTKGEAQK